MFRSPQQSSRETSVNTTSDANDHVHPGHDAISSPEDPRHERWAEQERAASSATRDIADVGAVEVITAAAVHMLSAAAVKVGLADDPDNQLDLDEARKLINALAGLVTAGAPEISD